jgi:transcription termination factor Rho
MTMTTESPARTRADHDDDGLTPVAGIVQLTDGHGFVRTGGYLPARGDVHVPAAQIRKNGLRTGDAVEGAARPPRSGGRDKHASLARVDTVNGVEPGRDRPEFAELTPLYPQERLRLESGSPITRIIDLISPIGKGQRGLIVSPPKAGKTMVLQAIAAAITENNPECHLMVVLVDERPEEVTDFQRSVPETAEVVHSTFDRPAADHTAVAELAIERAKRLVELGRDVVVLLDGITRLGRAYNLLAPNSSRILAGGVATTAIHPPRRFLGAARNIENGGSLTILATALVETGSRMDEVFFEEFKGTGNMELRLSRQLADKRLFPAVDVDPSSTRRDELLMPPAELQVVWQLRRVLHSLDSQQAIELLRDKVTETSSNAEFLRQIEQTTPALNGHGNSGNGSSRRARQSRD